LRANGEGSHVRATPNAAAPAPGRKAASSQARNRIARRGLSKAAGAARLFVEDRGARAVANSLSADRTSLAARLRQGARATWSDDIRRRRLIRTTAIWVVIAAALITFFALFSWDWFKGPLEHYASMKTHREVRIYGHLHVHPFSLQPKATVDGLTISQPQWLGGGKARMASVGRVNVQVKLLPLLSGKLELPKLDIERPNVDLYRGQDGRDNWTFGPKTNRAASLPPIEQFVIRDGRVHMADRQRKLVFDGTVGASETAQGSNAQGFRLDGKGELNSTPFLMRISGGALLHVNKSRPYRFDAEVRSGLSNITVRGQVVRPFDFARVNGTMNVNGRDLADLYRLTGIVFPNTPPYSLSGSFDRNEQKYSFPHFNGRVGKSDLGGALSVDKTSGRPFLRADLRSRSLDFNDLGALFGGPQAGSAPKTAVTAGPKRILPDAPLDVTRVRTMDANVRYHAASVKARGLPLRQVDLHLTLDHGLLKLAPVSFTFPSGQARGEVRLDARRSTPATDIDFRVDHLKVEDFAPKPQGLPAIAAPLEAGIKLHGSGDTVHKAAASSDGAVAVVLEGGQIRKALAELMGVNVIPGLPEYLSKDPKQAQLRCAVAAFDVKNGVMTARRVVLDTDVVTLNGSGTVNLGDEQMNLTFKGQSKKPRLIHLNAPFHLRGALAAPKFGVDVGPAVAQAGIGVALGALLSPLAAILPFLSPGGHHDADCMALLSEAKTVGAPVRMAAVPPVKH
jgi:uncharacterized protein involved in outer membrane biogenesis